LEVKIVIISDLHANFDALSALPETYDELWVLGDLVNYGPEPAAVVDFVRSKAAVTIRGNHDQSIGYNEDPRCSPPYREMAEATRQFTALALRDEDKHFLAELPLCLQLKRDNTRFYLCHAIPSNVLYGYCPEDSQQWEQELASIDSDVLLVGHTHTPFIRNFGSQTVANPGSLGQPKTGNTRACYAIWNGHSLELRSFEYPLATTIKKIEGMPIAASVKSDLIHVLRTGGELPVKKQPERERHAGD
jgi:putative phosphoesterase